MKSIRIILVVLFLTVLSAQSHAQASRRPTGSSVDGEILINGSNRVTGVTGVSVDSSGNATFRTVTTDDIAPSNAMSLRDNPDGFTQNLTFTDGIQLFADSNVLVDELFMGLDDNSTTYRVFRYQSGEGVRNCPTGSSGPVADTDNWCVTNGGVAKFKGSVQIWDNANNPSAVDTLYSVARMTSVMDSTVDTAETSTFKISTMGIGSGSGPVLKERYWIDSDGLHMFLAGDGGAGIALHVGDEDSNSVGLLPNTDVAGDIEVELPRYTSKLATDAGNLEASATRDVASSEMWGGFFVATANAFEFDLDPAIEGQHGCFWARTAAKFTIDPDDGDGMYLIGTGLLGNGVTVGSAGAIADSVCIRADSDGNWMMYAQNGIFVTP